MMNQFDPNEKPPSNSSKVIMALIAAVIVLGIWYFMHGNQFPTEISYDKLR